MTARSNLVHPTPIADLVPGHPSLVHGVVVHFGPVYDRPSAGRICPVRTIWLRDPTGEIPLALWGEEVGHLKEADRVLIVEAWVGKFRGKPELTLGSRGYVVNLGPASGRGPVWHPSPRDSLFVWGLVRRRLRERDLRASARRDAPSETPSPVPPAPTPTPVGLVEKVTP